ncbi:hypothetical protein [Cohnella silvisoli]|uniref:Mannosyl-glycoprotein endo-beta-N-acetylglucosamidase-like domain-containing protein n=1 Tax=Cohnella silvisoli TaxID=2873699 RepID=A0ABV1KNV1_9BACL|nr:hypothetical protein [Cohnella silvisoli]MCD9020962.1 hypothetical protein [Cohnella silvisoli]
MERAALLSPTDINVIRRYVHTKYAPLPGDRRAEIVADAIRRTLQQRLPNIPADLKNRMTDKLISDCLLGEQREVKPGDVLDLCAEFDYDGADHSERLLEPILSWVNERSPGRWSPEQLSSRLTRRNVQKLEWDLEGDLSVASGRPFPLFRLRIRHVGAWISAVIICATVVGLYISLSKPQPQQQLQQEVSSTTPQIAAAPRQMDLGMPQQLRYTDIDTKALKQYLRNRDALLAEEPYFDAIVNSAREYDIHPLLLFAITGQEQGFVPKSKKNAEEIANNPFNVFHSWEDYNTNIRDSSQVAAKLIAKLGKSRPEGHEPFVWFNKTYAEDPAWSDGVRSIFLKLNDLSAVSVSKAR